MGGWSGRNSRRLMCGPGDATAAAADVRRRQSSRPGAGIVAARRAYSAVVRARSMRPGAEGRSLAANVAGTRGRLASTTAFPKPQVQGSLSDARAKASEQQPAHAGPNARPAQCQSRRLPRCFARADRCPTSVRAARRSDHTGQPEILGLSLSRQQSAHRRAVPQHFQGRPPRPSQLFAAGSTGKTRPTTTTAC